MLRLRLVEHVGFNDDLKLRGMLLSNWKKQVQSSSKHLICVYLFIYAAKAEGRLTSVDEATLLPRVLHGFSSSLGRLRAHVAAKTKLPILIFPEGQSRAWSRRRRRRLLGAFV